MILIGVDPTSLEVEKTETKSETPPPRRPRPFFPTDKDVSYLLSLCTPSTVRPARPTHTASSLPHFLCLPPELHLLLIPHLPLADLHSLTLTTHYFHRLLQPRLLRRLQSDRILNNAAELAVYEAVFGWNSHPKLLQCGKCGGVGRRVKGGEPVKSRFRSALSAPGAREWYRLKVGVVTITGGKGIVRERITRGRDKSGRLIDGETGRVLDESIDLGAFGPDLPAPRVRGWRKKDVKLLTANERRKLRLSERRGACCVGGCQDEVVSERRTIVIAGIELPVEVFRHATFENGTLAFDEEAMLADMARGGLQL
ncbi:hypothetical protein BJ508DRAFT_329385 [Ascobolus immersus RN42]|uniref:F-box domain-containing protein n=1 Tax=Ascobolus immersus RN42 TaxID=1160509 RepID=A0A3N4HYL2_ASCIM|nr:hypothetical protein BJ508DRAFT_329385 [Ascobolus immersus RN42]